MIFGDQLILTRDGIEVSNKTLETIGIFPDTQVHMLPFRTFEYRESEQGHNLPMDLLITPIYPKLWPFVIRFVLRLYNRPGTLERALQFFRDVGINILFTECTRSGHHHSVLNVLGVINRLEGKKLSEAFKELKNWKEEKIKLQPFSNNNEEDDPWWFNAIKNFVNFLDKSKYNAANKNEKGTNDKIKFTEDLYEMLDKEFKNSEERKEKVGNSNKKIATIVSKFLAKKYIKKSSETGKLSEISLREMLEKEIQRIRPLVREYEESHLKGELSPAKLYRRIDDQMVPLKALLSVILTSKQMLCERYKLLIIEHSLEDIKLKENKDSDILYPEHYLYNIQYYLYQNDYLPFGDENLLNHYFAYLRRKKGKNAKNVDAEKVKEEDNKEEQGDIVEWEKKVENIIEKIEKFNCKPERKGVLGNLARIDLDPVIITPVESLCHAYYHLAFEMDFKCKSKSAKIPFPESFDPDYPERFLEIVLKKEKTSTIAIASRNTDDLTLRLCPLPARALESNEEFVSINLKNYTRHCYDECYEKGLHFAGDVKYCELLTNKNKNETRSHKQNNDNDCKGNNHAKEEQKIEPDTICNGTTRGLGYGLIKSINPESGEKIINIWRAYNKTYQFSEINESGSIHIIAQQIKQLPNKCDNMWKNKLEERFYCVIREELRTKHIKPGKIEINLLKAGDVFVSLPFYHPMSDEWLECIKEIGKRMGFFKIDTVRTYTQPVTHTVAEHIKKCDAMIQILSLELPKAADININNIGNSNKFTWLNAEYLAAITNGIKVVRLIDESTVDENKLSIGRDHATFKFSVGKPFEDFKEQAEAAFVELRKELAERLGLS